MKNYCLALIFVFCFFNVGYAQPYGFPPGNRFNMLDSPVNIRSQPTVSSEIVGGLVLHDEIEILEKTDIIQRIEGIDQFWYKIRFNNIIGYIWGGYVAVEKFIFDIDNNGIIDYVYYRYRNNRSIVSTNDLVIYINNERIPVNISSKYGKLM
jgi:hypothetical protein